PADQERFWPDIDLTITGTTLEFFWFRECRVRRASFRHTTFREIAAFRDTEFTEHADFHRAQFTGTADLRRASFGSRRANFRNTIFGGDVDFGDEPEAGRKVDLTDAAASASADRRWPAGWRDEPSADEPDRVDVVPDA
ncbi:MAG: pentapeptide repeat-containing protein, partial [Actinomycetota bacterium]|nr:pentapeptide repeat-containing protein [Actinomycetota bacterium]